MTSSPITSWEIDGETVETVSDFIIIIIFTLQYCIGFAIYQHASATGVHGFN